MSSRNKELKEEYKQMKLPMGIVIIKCLTDNKCYIEATPNLKGTMNRANFELDLGSHKSKELQKAWKESGKDNFTTKVLDVLDYDNNKTDYKDDLLMLKEIWAEKLEKEQGLSFYK